MGVDDVELLLGDELSDIAGCPQIVERLIPAVEVKQAYCYAEGPDVVDLIAGLRSASLLDEEQRSPRPTSA